jgi:glucose/arabinose dehydrogenase
MRTAATLALALAAACGDGIEPKDASDVPAHCPSRASGTNIQFRQIADLGTSAVLATSPPDDPRLFVVAQEGAIHIFKEEVRLLRPFLDLRADEGGPVAIGGEMGLLGLAFHPKYATNGVFFVFYTTGNVNQGTLRDVLARCTVSADPDVADRTCTEVLSIPDFAANHNGGMIEFGDDGFLYIGTGDGGGSGDPNGNGQSLEDGAPLPASVALLGKMLRIDVDHPAPGKAYGIPADNPFAIGGGAPEIFMYGLRNPWRWSFDRATGDMWIGDVGQAEIEELTALTPAQQKGANLGWKKYEGTRCFDPPCAPAGMVMPQYERTHAEGWASITGGQVYRGTCYPDLVGQYFFGDHEGSAYVRATFDGTTVTTTPIEGSHPGRPASLHAGPYGELYLTSSSGPVFHLEAAP